MITIILWSIAASLAALVLFLSLARSRTGFLIVGVLSLVFALFSPLFILSAVGIQMMVTMAASIIGVLFNPRRWLAKVLVIAPVLLAYGVVTYSSLWELRRADRLKREYPLTSLAARLDYEPRAGEVRNVATEPVLSGVVAEQLEKDEQSTGWNQRRAMLRVLYSRSHEDFVLATGFGPGRMQIVFQEPVVLDDAGPISLARPDAHHPVPASASDAASSDQLPDQPALRQLHDDGRHDLLDPDRFGYVEDLDHVAGFESHRFSRIPKPADDPGRRWTLVRLELVGLMKYDRPKVYVSEYLPRLDELGEAATREIDDFERSALERLETDEDLVIDEAPADRIRMLGSLRAAKDCLECHSVQRGQLLGALSYEILPLEQNRDTLGDQARLNHPLSLDAR